MILPTGWRWRSEAFCHFARLTLRKSREPLKWLAARGIRAETAFRRGIGWNPETTFRPRESWSLPPLLNGDGKPKKLWLPRGLVIPVRNFFGELVRLKIRRPESDRKNGIDIPYYALQAPGVKTPSLVYRREPSTLPEAAVIVESELDAVLLAQEVGDLCHVAALGSAAAAPSPELADLLRGCRVILVALDFDSAGLAAWERWAPARAARLAPVPSGKDPGEAFKVGVDLRRWALEFLPPVFRLNSGGKKQPEERSMTLPGNSTGGGAEDSVTRWLAAACLLFGFEQREDKPFLSLAAARAAYLRWAERPANGLVFEATLKKLGLLRGWTETKIQLLVDE